MIKISDYKNRLVHTILVFCILVFTSTLMAEIYVWYDADSTRNISNVKPDWWTDEMSQMSPQDIVVPVEATPQPGKFVGDNENRKFHKPTCEQIQTLDGFMAIPEHKRVWFASYDEAKAQNYTACTHCKPVKSESED